MIDDIPMETGHFLAWVGAIASIATFALVVMLRAYGRTAGFTPRFQTAVPLATSGENSADTNFQRGYDAFQNSDYRKSAEQFTKAVQSLNTFAEAYHNLGLAQANLRQDNEAVRNLVKAGELYLERSDQEKFLQIKQALEQMKRDRTEA